MRKTIFTFLALCFFAALVSCSSDVDYQITQKDLPDDDTNKYYATTQTATKVYFYLQNKEGSAELSTYERDKASDIENANIPKGTPVSQLESLKSYVGYTFYTASQTRNVLNLYYSRNKVTYEFYSARVKGTLVYRTVGLYENKVSPPEYTPLESCFVIDWEDDDGTSIGAAYGAYDKKYYPRLLTKEEAVGTKAVADTKGDILLDDGTVISYKEFCDLDNNGKNKVALHAFGVLVCPSYKPDQTASSAPEDGNDNFYKNNVDNNDARKSIYSGDKKLVAALFKKNDSSYNGVPWINDNDSLLKCSMSLENYFDGNKNASLLKDSGKADGGYMQGAVAFSSCESYGDAYCANTRFADGWHLPSVGELGVLYDAFFSETNKAVWAALTARFYDFNTAGKIIWTSNASEPDNPDLYSRPVRKSWAVDFSDMKTLETARDMNGNVIPFMFY